MAGFEPRFSGIGSKRSTNCVTTTAHMHKSKGLKREKHLHVGIQI